ncbi:MAG: hypothetical protein RQ922_03895 [Thermoproteota archaeon]|jgi:uncharacterized membrane protein YciS (DUF1049 family)|nr:hypothetical protein [Thermoproteota archaeon]
MKEEIKKVSSFNYILSKFKKRIPYYILFTIFLFLIFEVFILVWLIQGVNVNKVKGELDELSKQIEKKNVYEKTQFIFSNNYRISLLFIPPIIGIFFFTVVMHNTAEFFAYYSIIRAEEWNIDPSLASLIITISLIFSYPAYFFPFLEFLGYSLTFSQGLILLAKGVKTIFKGNIKEFLSEIYYTIFIITLAAIILLIAAYLEALVV